MEGRVYPTSLRRKGIDVHRFAANLPRCNVTARLALHATKWRHAKGG
jgi:hypothetical protein